MLCNLLTTLLRPNFEEPLDTAKQLVEKDITIYFEPTFEVNKQWLLDSPILEYRILGENAIITDDTNHFNNITADDVMGAGTHAQMNYLISWYELELGEKHHPEGRGWYRAKEKVAGSPYTGYLTNKKWYLKEVLSKIKYTLRLFSILTLKEMAKHLLYFQQVN